MSNESRKGKPNRHREIVKKKDSTKGSSDFIPLTYKGDVLVQVWVDSRILATLSNWLEEYDNYPRFMSEVVRRPLEILIDHIVKEGDIDMIEDTTTARRMLEERYRINLNRDGRGKKNVMHNTILSGNRSSLSGMPMNRDSNRNTNIEQHVGSPIVNVDEMINKVREDKKKAEDYRQKELSDAIDSRKVMDEFNDETSIKEGMSDEELLKDREDKDKKRMELENAPIDVKDFDLVKGNE